MHKLHFILIAGIAFSLLTGTSIAYAIDNYPDSGVPCGQASGPVLCDMNFSQPGLGITVKIPTDAYPHFPKSAQDFIGSWIDASKDEFASPGGLTRYFQNFYGAAIYAPLRDAIANTCTGGSVITQPQTDYFWGKGIHLQNTVCGSFPSCDRFWVEPGREPGPGTIHSWADSAEEWGIDRGNPESYGARLPAGAFPSVSVPACAPLASKISLSLSAETIPEGSSYRVDWNSGGNPGVICSLSGKMPNNFSANSASGSNTFFNVATGVYTHVLTCTGILDGSKSAKSGSITKTKIIKVGDIPPPPSGQLTASSAEIKKGDSVTLTWEVGNAVSVSIDQGVGTVAAKGSIKVFPKFTTRYTLEAAGKYPELGGKLRSSVTVRVQTPDVPTKPVSEPPPVTQPVQTQPTAPAVQEPKLDLKVNGQDGPITLNAPASFEISWNLDRYCIAYGSGWLGVKSKAATQTVNNSTVGSHTYKMYCPGFSSTSDSVTVTIVNSETTGVSGQASQPVAVPIAEAGISLDGTTYSRSIRVIRGKPVSLWVSASKDVNGDAKSSRDTYGGWSEIQNGGQCQFNVDLNIGTPTFEGVVDEPTKPQMCDVPFGEKTFNDPPGVYRYGVLRLVQGDGKTSGIAYINVAVVNPPPPKGPPVIDLNVNGKTGKVTLGVPSEYAIGWTTQDADMCTASGAWSGDKSVSGNQTFVGSAKKELTYGLTCKGKLGTTTQSVIVKLAEVPVCSFTALPSVLDKRSVFVRESELSWSCKFADTCRMVPALGSKVAIFGSARVSPIVSTTYTLICGNAEGEQSFDAGVEIR